jgi:tetratricopeptide (TPR) repeat protein
MSFVIFMFVVVIGGLVLAGVISAYARDRAWREAALALDLKFQSDAPFGGCSLSGEANGLDAAVRTNSRESATGVTKLTVYTVAFATPLGFPLSVRQARFVTAVAAQDIEVGDAEFDADFVVAGSPSEKVIQFLTPARRLRCARFLRAVGECEITDTGLQLTRIGTAADPGAIVRQLRRMLALAQYLDVSDASDASGASADGEVRLDAALEARAKGELDTALKEVRAAPQEDADVRVVEGEILYVSGQYDDAKEAFAEAERIAPDDTEAKAWRERADAKAKSTAAPEIPPELVSPALGEAAPEKGSREARKLAKVRKLAARVQGRMDRREPVAPSVGWTLDAPTTSEVPTGGLESDAVCGALFGADTSGIETSRVFEERFFNQSVQWVGTLEFVMATSFDLVFGSRGMAKATLVVHEATVGGLSGLKVRAVVAFPEGDVQALRERRGELVAFSGRLVRCDPLVRNLFVDEAFMLDAAEASGRRAEQQDTGSTLS